MCTQVYFAIVLMLKSEGSLWELKQSFYHVWVKDQSLVIKLENMYLC